MTTLLYQTDSYLKEFDATVLAATDEGVVLDQSAFYPGGGGQPADTGTLGVRDGPQVAVTGLRRIHDRIIHILEGEARPRDGATVHGVIDWQRRYMLMRTHTAMHILCGVIWRNYGAQVTGGNMEPGRGRMDFEFERMQRELIDEIEAKCNEEVQAETPVRISILPRAEALNIPNLIRTKINLLPDHIREVRVVEVVGLDLQADGGTHVGNTREVGPLKIIDYKSKGKINKRIVIGLESQA